MDGFLSIIIPFLTVLAVIKANGLSPLIVYREAGRETIKQPEVTTDALGVFLGDLDNGIAPALHAYASPFREWKEKHDGSSLVPIMGALRSSNLALFLSWLTDEKTSSIDDLISRRVGWTVLVNFSKALRVDHLRLCSSEACLQLLTAIFDISQWKQIPRQVLIAGINGLHLQHLLIHRRTICKDMPTPLEQTACLSSLKEIPLALYEEYAEMTLDILASILFDLPNAVLQTILTSSPHLCQRLPNSTLTRLLLDSNRASLLTAQCITLLDLSILGTVDRIRLPPSSLELYHGGLTEKATRSLSAKQLQSYALNCKGNVPLGLHLEWLGRFTALPFITFRQVLSRSLVLLRDELSNSHLLGENWRYIPTSIFQKQPADELNLIFRAIAKEEPQYFSSALVQLLMEEFPSWTCSLLLPQNINADLALHSVSCFNHMQPSTQASVLVKMRNLPERLLSNISSNIVEQWEYGTLNNGKPLYGLQIFSAIQQKNSSALLWHLGEDPNGPSPCSLLTNLAELEHHPVLQKNISLKCFLDGGLLLPRNPKRMRQLIRLILQLPFPALLSFLGPKYLENISTEEARLFITQSSFCSEVDEDTLDILPEEFFQEITLKCLEQLAPLKEYQVKLLSYQLLRMVPVDYLPQIYILYMTPNQLRVLAADVPDRGTGDKPPSNRQRKNLGSIITAPMMATFTMSQIRAFDDSNWRACHPTAFAGINRPEKLATIDPECTVNWTMEQILNIPLRTWTGLTVAQAGKIGSQQPGITAILYDLRGMYMEPETLWALEDRQLEESIYLDRPVALKWVICSYLILIWMSIIVMTIRGYRCSISERRR